MPIRQAMHILSSVFPVADTTIIAIFLTLLEKASFLIYQYFLQLFQISSAISGSCSSCKSSKLVIILLSMMFLLASANPAKSIKRRYEIPQFSEVHIFAKESQKHFLHLRNYRIKSPVFHFFTHFLMSIKVWPNWPALFANMSNLTCSPTMLPNLATMLANKFRSRNVRGMFVHAQNIFANICCSIECCLIWPLCSRTIQLSHVKVAKIS